jgi:hypothetical protein
VQVSRTTWGCQKERGGTHATHTHSVEQSCPAGSRFALAGGIPVQQKSHPRRPWQLIISWGYACLPRDSVGFQQNQPHDRLSTEEQQPQPADPHRLGDEDDDRESGRRGLRPSARLPRPQGGGSPTKCPFRFRAKKRRGSAMLQSEHVLGWTVRCVWWRLWYVMTTAVDWNDAL